MDVKGVRESLLELASYYFSGATVVYAKQSHVAKQGKPLVTLSFGSVTRPINPPTVIIDGRPVSFYPTTMTVQIDLFTKGQKLELGNGRTIVMENTAVDDMLDFVNFLNSEYTKAFCSERDIAIIVPNNVEDMSSLINDVNYEFRAMAELSLSFTTQSVGYSGTLSQNSIKGDEVLSIVPEVKRSSSGGGNESVVEDEDSYFVNVAINDSLVKED